MGIYFYKDGTPFPDGPDSVLEWAKYHEKNHRVKSTHRFFGLVYISTVYIGIDVGHRFRNSQAPLIYETMVFMFRAWTDLACDRYSTEKLALEGHSRMVREWGTWRVVPNLWRFLMADKCYRIRSGIMSWFTRHDFKVWLEVNRLKRKGRDYVDKLKNR